MPTQAETEFDERVRKLRESDPHFKDAVIETLDDLFQAERESSVFARATKAWKEPEGEIPVLTEVTKTAVLDAMSMFMRYVPVVKIEMSTGINMAILRELIYEKGGWKEQRELAYKEATTAIRVVAAAKLRDGVSLGIDLILNSFRALKSECEANNEAPTIDEAEQISNILRRLHGAQVIEEKANKGKAKDMISLPPEGIIQALSEDPYLKSAIMSAIQTGIEAKEDTDGKRQLSDSDV